MNNAICLINGYPPPQITGLGTCIAILDTGICPTADFVFPKNRLACFMDFVNGKTEPYDDNGHGTHVAGIACGNGYLSGKRYMGVAPESSIVALKILDQYGHGTARSALNALEWLLANRQKYGIRIVNMSIGTNDPSISSSLIKATNTLWNSGMIVVAASGNDESSGITAPGTSQNIITVGNFGEKVLYKIQNGNRFYYKPDIFAPGENIVSCKAETFSFESKKRSNIDVVDINYVKMSGTSMATPMVSGAAALILQHSPKLSPNQVKHLICSAASNSEPMGLLNIEKIFYS